MAAYAHESITVAGTAIGLTEAKIALADSLYGRPVKRIIATVETAQIRVTFDGTTPTSTVGHIANVADVLEIDGADARKFRAIRVSSSGALKCTYEV